MDSRVYVFPFRSLSVNDLYGTIRGHKRGRDRYLKDKTYHPRIYSCMEFQDNLFYDGIKLTIQPDEYLYFKYFFCFKDEDYYVKNSKTLNHIDCSNQVKGLEDGIVKYLGIDDKMNKALFLTKMPSSSLIPGLQDNFTIVYITSDVDHTFIDNKYDEITNLYNTVKSTFENKE